MIIFNWKSHRVNAKMASVILYDNGDCINHICNFVENCICNINKLGTKKIIVSGQLSTVKTLTKKTVDEDAYKFDKWICLNFGKREFYSIEELINFIWSLNAVEHPESTLSPQDLFENDRIKYLIKKWYGGVK